jgi:hypothetical protein
MPHRRFEGADQQEASQFLCHERRLVQRRSIQAFSRLRIRTLDRMPERTSARLRLLEHAEPARSNLSHRFGFPSPRRIWQSPDRREPIVAGAVGPEAQTGQGTAFPARMARLMLRPGAVRNSPLDFLEKRGLSATVPFTPGYHLAASSAVEPSTTGSASNPRVEWSGTASE